MFRVNAQFFWAKFPFLGEISFSGYLSYIGVAFCNFYISCPFIYVYGVFCLGLMPDFSGRNFFDYLSYMSIKHVHCIS